MDIVYTPHWVGHSRTEEADAKVPAWLINWAQHSIAGTDFPDEQKIHIKSRKVHCNCPRHPLGCRVYGRASADILQEIRSVGSLG
jgi:hypothetical protein